MKKLLKIALIVFAAVVVAAVAFAVSVLIKYNSIEKQNIAPEIIKTETLPTTESITLGHALQLEYQVKCPWDKEPIDSEIFPGKGSQTVGDPKFVKFKTTWGYFIWKMILKVQPYLTGNIPGGKAVVKFSPGIDDKIDQITFKIPGFISNEIPKVQNKLFIANQIKPKLKRQTKKNIYYWLGIIGIVLILALIFWCIFRRSKEESKPLTSWALALLNLNELNETFTSGKLSAAKCIANLTDIVRNYLESRFSIHAPRQTTNEFLRNMEESNSPLNNKDKNFLKEFMTSADMIKFAKFEAPKSQVETAIERAIQLVD